MQDDRFLTIPEVVRRTGIGRRQFAKALRRGELNVYDLGSWPRVRWEDVLRWLHDKRREPGAPREVRP